MVGDGRCKPSPVCTKKNENLVGVVEIEFLKFLGRCPHFFHIGRVYSLFTLHTENQYFVQGCQFLVIILGIEFNPLGHEILADNLLHEISMMVFIGDPPHHARVSSGNE